MHSSSDDKRLTTNQPTLLLNINNLMIETMEPVFENFMTDLGVQSNPVKQERHTPTFTNFIFIEIFQEIFSVECPDV